MSVRGLTILVTLAVLAMGCRQDPYQHAYLETLRAEKLWIEDKYYDLEYEYETKIAQLDEYRQENGQLRQRLGLGDAEAIESGQNGDILSSPQQDQADLNEPRIDFGMPVHPASYHGDLPNDRSDRSILRTTSGQQLQAESSTAIVNPSSHDPIPQSLDTRVTHIVIDPFLTSGHDFDRKPGDDGISVVVEPRNADDQSVPVPGPLSVVVLDSLEEGEEARVARWDFDTAEVSQRLASPHAKGLGINLKLPWPHQPPKHSKLHLFVRYECQDGRKLEAKTEIFVALPGQFSSRWTPKSSDFASRSASPSKHADSNTIANQQVQSNVGDDARGNVIPASGVMPDAGNASPSPVAPTGRAWQPAKSTKSRRPMWSPFR